MGGPPQPARTAHKSRTPDRAVPRRLKSSPPRRQGPFAHAPLRLAGRNGYTPAATPGTPCRPGRDGPGRTRPPPGRGTSGLSAAGAVCGARLRVVMPPVRPRRSRPDAGQDGFTIAPGAVYVSSPQARCAALYCSANRNTRRPTSARTPPVLPTCWPVLAAYHTVITPGMP